MSQRAWSSTRWGPRDEGDRRSWTLLQIGVHGWRFHKGSCTEQGISHGLDACKVDGSTLFISSTQLSSKNTLCFSLISQGPRCIPWFTSIFRTRQQLFVGLVSLRSLLSTFKMHSIWLWASACPFYCHSEQVALPRNWLFLLILTI